MYNKNKEFTRGRAKPLAHPNFKDDPDIQRNVAIWTNEIEFLEKKNTKESRGTTNAEITVHGEKLGGIWTALSKNKKLRDLGRMLKIPNRNPQKYEYRSKGMADPAKRYHDEIQNRDLDP